MRLKNRVSITAVLALCIVPMTAQGAGSRTQRATLPVVSAGAPDFASVPADAPLPARRDEVNYDDVGYAFIPRDSGSESVSVTHATLPIDSFAEVTNLQNGRTILVRVSEHGPLAAADLLSLSPGAARQLGVEDNARLPVRIRRVNPPEFERRLLASGGHAVERLPTPPGLLNALKLKLKDQPVAKREQIAPSAAMAHGMPAKTAKAPPVKATPKPVVKSDKAVVSGTSDGFIVEERTPHWTPQAMAASSRVKVAVAAKPLAKSGTGSYFVQIGAFSSETAARAVASRAGANAVNGGSLWRVRVGPYQNAAEAQRALGGLRAKGYRDARVTR